MIIWAEVSDMIFTITFYIYLVISTLLFLLRQQRRSWFPLRFLLTALIGLVCVVLFNTNMVGTARNLTAFSVALLSTTVLAYFCFQVTFTEALFCSVGGYGIQFIQSTLAEMVERAIPGAYPYLEYFRFLSALIVLPVCYFLFCRQLKKGRNIDLSKRPMLILLIAVVLIEIIICYNLRQEWKISSNPAFIISDCLMIVICSFCLLTIQFTLLLKKNLEDELEVQQQMLRKEQNQYHISKEIIDTINQKCHDMRHQIHAIGKNARIDPVALAEMEDAIGIYDALGQTGSKALDIILAEKALVCHDRGIEINCMADGEKLAFMRDTDIYSLFGNILENAIHAVQELDPEQRTISLTIKMHGTFLSVNSHNRYTGQIIMENDRPVTASSDTANRGFGTKSITAITQKYGGTVSFQAKDGLFNLNILIPINDYPAESAAKQ